MHHSNIPIDLYSVSVFCLYWQCWSVLSLCILSLLAVLICTQSLYFVLLAVLICTQSLYFVFTGSVDLYSVSVFCLTGSVDLYSVSVFCLYWQCCWALWSSGRSCMRGAERWNTGTTWSANHRSWSGNGTRWDPLTQYRALNEQHATNSMPPPPPPLSFKTMVAFFLIFEVEVFFFQYKTDIRISNGIKQSQNKRFIYSIHW